MIQNGGSGRRISIAGVGRTMPCHEDRRSIPEMVLEAAEQALADAELSVTTVDAVVTASVDLFDGLTASNIAVTEVVGAVMKPETRIAADGLAALVHGACPLWAGAYETVLVVAHGKASMAPQSALTPWAMDPIYLQPLGIDFDLCAGLQARLLAAEDDSLPQEWAELAATRRLAAAEAGYGSPCSVEEVLDSPILASPLRVEMRAPLADGACAVVLRAATVVPAGQLVLTGVGHDLDSHDPGVRMLGCNEGMTRACHRARRVAGLDIGDRFDLLELSCRYPHEEALLQAAAEIGEPTLLSPTGGLFGGDVPVAAGLGRLVEATRRMRREPTLRRALVHGSWGPAGQANAIAILEAAA